MSNQGESSGTDLAAGVALADIPEGGMLGGHVGKESVLLARRNGRLFALSTTCPHYGGSLDQGLVVGETVRCPLHHARFDLRSGMAVGAPALSAVTSWQVETANGKAYVRERATPWPPRPPLVCPSSVVIVGGGAAGQAAAERLRLEGYDGPVTLLSSDTAPPYDRPQLSKGYLAGSAPAGGLPLRGDPFYNDFEIELRLETEVEAIDPKASQVRLGDGSRLDYGALLLATGAAPVRLQIPGDDLAHVHYLCNRDDCEAIIGSIEAGAQRAVVVGASFISLEVASSLCQRDIEVHVVAPEARPLEQVMGEALGDFFRSLHESQGVIFHLQQSLSRFEEDAVVLNSGEQIDCDLAVVGVGVQPRTMLAEETGLAVDGGVLVNKYLQTSAANIYAAGDIARWPPNKPLLHV